MTLSTRSLHEAPLLARDPLADTLRNLVRINSVNPAYGGPQGGERRALEWAAHWLAEHGLDPRLHDAAEGRAILRTRLNGAKPGPAVLFETHVDTVSARGMTIDPFEGAIHDGRLWGRGATDAKGQATAMLHALAAWTSSGHRPPRAIELALVCDEEFGFAGARALLAAGIDAEAIVIGEPTGLRVVTSHKGCVRLAVSVKGKMAHASRPELGVNAISAAAVLIDEINAHYIPELRRRRAPLLSPPTLNVAAIEGGVQPNLIPDDCRMILERRTLPGETAADVRREIEHLFEAAAERFPAFHARLEPTLLEAAPLQTDASSAPARAAGEVAAAHGRPADPLGVDFCTDAAVLGATGLPIIIAGPGSIDQAHTADESIALEDLVAGAQFYFDLMGRIGRA